VGGTSQNLGVYIHPETLNSRSPSVACTAPTPSPASYRAARWPPWGRAPTARCAWPIPGRLGGRRPSRLRGACRRTSPTATSARSVAASTVEPPRLLSTWADRPGAVGCAPSALCPPPDRRRAYRPPPDRRPTAVRPPSDRRPTAVPACLQRDFSAPRWVARGRTGPPDGARSGQRNCGPANINWRIFPLRAPPVVRRT
jgi:hypothetical protein